MAVFVAGFACGFFVAGAIVLVTAWVLGAGYGDRFVEQHRWQVWAETYYREQVEGGQE